MYALRSRLRTAIWLVLLAFVSLSLHVPAARAAMISTSAVVNHQTALAERAQLQALLERQEVRRKLVAMGVNPQDVQARVASLTDQQVHQLATRIKQLPAGGDGFIGALVFIFIVLLITDILGFTDIFPFVKKHVNVPNTSSKK